jgi:predicted lipid-binding transport protein (Tim44 family)
VKPGIPTRFLAAALLLSPLVFPQAALACAACFGRSDSPMAKGMNMGILSLLIVVMAVLAGIASFFIFLMVRAARLAGAAPAVAPFPPAPAPAQPTP